MTARMVEYLCARMSAGQTRGARSRPWHVVADATIDEPDVRTRCGLSLLNPLDIQTRYSVDGMCETCMRAVLR